MSDGGAQAVDAIQALPNNWQVVESKTSGPAPMAPWGTEIGQGQMAGHSAQSSCRHVGVSLDASFCPRCGAAIHQVTERRLCLWCGAACDAAEEFCSRCGAHKDAVAAGLPLPSARAWSEIFAELGWGDFAASPASWGLFRVKREALERELGDPSSDAGNPWVFATASDPKPKPGMLAAAHLQGPGIPKWYFSRFRPAESRFVAATRCEIAMPYFTDRIVTVLNAKSKPPLVARVAFVDVTEATWSNSRLSLATNSHRIDLEIRPPVSAISKFLNWSSRWAAVGGILASESAVESYANKLWLDTHGGNYRRMTDAESAFDTMMTRLCEEILAVSPSGLPRPGWYPDPYRRTQWRWWDGVAWTPRCSVGSREVTDPDLPSTGLFPLPCEATRQVV